MHLRALNCLITLTTLFSQSAGELVTTPNSTESKIGDTTYFNCSTNLQSKEIYWNHGEQYVYSEHGILNPYRGRFEIERNASNGSYNLVIHSVQPSDAGEYICIDDDGHGTRRSAELVVLDNDPACQSNIHADGIIGQNIFNIPLDTVQLTCSLTYHGNIPPKMDWRRIGENRSIKDNVTSIVTSNNHFMYTVEFTSHISLDKSSYVCQTTRSTQHQYKCTSEVIKVLYFLDGSMIERKVYRGDKITCSARRNTFPCISQWHYGNDTFDESITTQLLGEYMCRVECRIRGTNHSFEAMKAVVGEAPSNSGAIVVAAVVVPIVVIILVVLIAASIVRYKKRKYSWRYYAERWSRIIELEHEMLMGRLFDDEIHDKNERDLTNVAKEEIELVHKIKNERTSEEKAILGVSILDRRMFVVFNEDSHLGVYDCTNFHVGCDSVNVTDLVAAYDICSSKIGNCLYIMDKKDEDVDELRRKSIPREVLQINAEGIISRKWPTVDYACGALSVSADGNVVITVHDNHKLLEYSADGNFVLEISLPKCTRPWHAIKLENDQYIVSHGTYDHQNRVCLVNETGKVMKSFGHDMGSTENQLNIPFYLAIGTSGCVFVADRCNNRVLLLDKKSLEFKANIVSTPKQRFRAPRRLYLDETLFVVVITPHDLKKNKAASLKKQAEASAPNLLLGNQEEDTIRMEVGDSIMEESQETEEGDTTSAKESLLGKTEEGKMKEKSYHMEKISEERIPLESIPTIQIPVADDSRRETEEGETSVAIENLRKKAEGGKINEGDPYKHTEEEYPVLVFDIRQLLHKYAS